jgi:AcrR family transcriptional regulator
VVRAPQQPTADMRILDLASEHVRKFGASRLTVVAVAEELGMSHANVYRYFPSKAALLEAATAQWLKPIEASMRTVAEGPDPARDKLERALSGLHRAYRDKMEFDARLFDVLLDSFRARAGLARKHRARILTETRRVLEDGVASGAFVADDLGRAVALVVDSTHRFIHPLNVAEDRDVPRAHLIARLDRVLDSTLSALVQRKTPGARHVN